MKHLDPDGLALAAMNELDLTARQRDHLAGCPDCAREVAALRRTVAVARTAHTVELLQPADTVWQRIHGDLGLSDAVAAPPRLHGASPTGDANGDGSGDDADGADDVDDTGDANGTDDTNGADGANGAEVPVPVELVVPVVPVVPVPVAPVELGGAGSADGPVPVPVEPVELVDSVGAGDPGASVTPPSPGTLPLAAAAGLMGLVGGIAGRPWRRPQPPTAPATP